MIEQKGGFRVKQLKKNMRFTSLFVVGLCSVAWGQNAVILGTVYTAEGAPASGMTIVVSNPVTNFSRVAITAADGSYSIPEIPPGGSYRIEALQEGRLFDARSNIYLNVGDERSILPPLRPSKDFDGRTPENKGNPSTELRGFVFAKNIEELPIGAQVVLQGEGEKPRKAVVNYGGDFDFGKTRPGKYSLKVFDSGDLLAVVSDLQVFAGRINKLDVELATQGVNQMTTGPSGQPPRLANVQRRGRDYAILIATNKYDNWKTLINPVNDARTIAKELRDNYGYQADLLENPTTDDIFLSIRSLQSRKFSPDDRLLIFIAGHGAFDEASEQGYVVGRDGQSKGPTALRSYLAHTDLAKQINGIPARHILVVLDVCFGGSFDQRLAASVTRGGDEYSEVDVDKFVARKLQYRSRLYLTSGGVEYVPDGRPGQHSPFARKFLEALRLGPTQEGILTMGTVKEIMGKLDPMPRAGEFGTSEPGADFIFLKSH